MDLVEANIAWLTVMREVHEENTANLAERSRAALGFEQSYEGELMRRYELRYGSALDRTIKTYEKVRGKDGRGNDEPPRRPFDFRTAKRGSGPAGKPDGRDMESAMVACANDTAASRPVEDTKWAGEISAEDVRACGGLLPKRVKAEGECLDGSAGASHSREGECLDGSAGASHSREGECLDGSAGASHSREGECLDGSAGASHSREGECLDGSAGACALAGRRMPGRLGGSRALPGARDASSRGDRRRARGRRT